jgi:nucleoside-diphosphate-sugar epimerase
MRVLVTGASGLLGSSVARALVAAGHTVTTLQRRPSGVDGAHDVLGSTTDSEAVARAMAGVAAPGPRAGQPGAEQRAADVPGAGQDAVVHLAAKVSMAGDPADFDRVNIAGTRNVVTAAQEAGVPRFVHISSPSVAHAGTSIVGEGAGPADPQRARGDYARTKAAGELIALGADADDFRVLVLRPHLMWGPGDAQLTERIIDRAKAGSLPILGSGAMLVDTLFVTNAVDAIVAGLTAVDRAHGQSLVVTNGQPRPIGELLRRIAIAGGAAEPHLRVPAAVGRAAGTAVERVWNLSEHDDEPPLTHFLAEQLSTAHWFDQRRTREVLDWTPAVSIEQGLELVARAYA